jgi:outer membrane protein OmpA-like peptidoglycan-associated protein
MRSFRRFLLLAGCSAAFLGVAGCGHRSAAPKQAMQTPSANATQKEMKEIVAPVPSGTAPAIAPAAAAAAPSSSAISSSRSASAQSTTPDERLALALKHLGAQRGPQGEVLQLPNLSFGPSRAQFKAGTGTDVEQVVALLRDYPKALLLIEGYTDNRGSEQLNDRLSLQRAKSVQQALVADGLNATRIRMRGLGSTDPIADNGTREGRDKNRRVELVFSNSAGTFASAGDQITAG